MVKLITKIGLAALIALASLGCKKELVDINDRVNAAERVSKTDRSLTLDFGDTFEIYTEPDSDGCYEGLKTGKISRRGRGQTYVVGKKYETKSGLCVRPTIHIPNDPNAGYICEELAPNDTFCARNWMIE